MSAVEKLCRELEGEINLTWPSGAKVHTTPSDHALWRLIGKHLREAIEADLREAPEGALPVLIVGQGESYVVRATSDTDWDALDSALWRIGNDEKVQALLIVPTDAPQPVDEVR